MNLLFFFLLGGVSRPREAEAKPAFSQQSSLVDRSDDIEPVNDHTQDLSSFACYLRGEINFLERAYLIGTIHEEQQMVGSV
jgi:hypothetical protein